MLGRIYQWHNLNLVISFLQGYFSYSLSLIISIALYLLLLEWVLVVHMSQGTGPFPLNHQTCGHRVVHSITILSFYVHGIVEMTSLSFPIWVSCVFFLFSWLAWLGVYQSCSLFFSKTKNQFLVLLFFFSILVFFFIDFCSSFYSSACCKIKLFLLL